MHVGLLELAAEAFRTVAHAHGDGHLVDPPDGTVEDALRDASLGINAGLAHLRGALVAVQPTIKASTRPRACKACEATAIEVEAAIRALLEPLP